MPDVERDEYGQNVDALWTVRSEGVMDWIPVRGYIIADENPYEERGNGEGNDRREDEPMRHHPLFRGETIKTHVEECDGHLGCCDCQEEGELPWWRSLDETVSNRLPEVTAGTDVKQPVKGTISRDCRY